jgi:hypothetical protein
MANLPASQWFFEVLGKKSGPYSTEKILDLYRSGQLGARVQLIPDAPGQAEITLEELIGLSQFQPPPKPEIAKEGDHFVTLGNDPSMNLFDALQAAKDRKASPTKPMPAPHYHHEAPATSFGNGSGESWFPEIPTGAWFAIAGLFGVTVGGWFLWSYIREDANHAAQQEAQNKSPTGSSEARRPTAAPVSPEATKPTLSLRSSSLSNAPVRFNRAPTSPIFRSPAGNGSREDPRRAQEEKERQRRREEDERADAAERRAAEERPYADRNDQDPAREPSAEKPAEGSASPTTQTPDPDEDSAESGDPDSSRID